MKVLLATHFFPPGHPGGTESYTLGLAKTLRSMGHSPFVICAEEWGMGDSWIPRHEDAYYEGIPVRRLYWNWKLAPNPFVNSYNNPQVERHFGSYVDQLRPDVVHITSCYSLSAAIISASRGSGVSTFLTLTDFWFLCPRHTLLRWNGSLCDGPTDRSLCQRCVASGWRGYRWLTRLIPASKVDPWSIALSGHGGLARLRGFRAQVGDTSARLSYLRRAFSVLNGAIAPSRFLMDTFVRNGFPPDRFIVSRYGLETSWKAQMSSGERPEGTAIRLGYIGQIEPIKGVDLLLRALRILPPDVAVELRIHGDMSKNPRYSECLIRLAGGDSRVRFLGPFERPAIASVLSQLDVVVVPSTWYENSPLVIAEAHAARRPVIATNLAGMSEVVEEGVSGLLFEPGDVEGLAGAIRRVAVDPALLKRLQAGIGPVRSIEDEVKDLVGLYSSPNDRASADIRDSASNRTGITAA